MQRTLIAICAVLLALAFARNGKAEESADSGKTKVVLCKEHGVPETICVLCHPKLAAQYKKKGDWCKEHKVPESQCIACHPELEEKYKEMAAGKEAEDPKSKDKKSDENKSDAKGNSDSKK